MNRKVTTEKSTVSELNTVNDKDVGIDAALYLQYSMFFISWVKAEQNFGGIHAINEDVRL